MNQILIFCIFFGPTPASDGPQSWAYRPVNVVGRIVGDSARYRAVPSGAPVTITAAPS